MRNPMFEPAMPIKCKSFTKHTASHAKDGWEGTANEITSFLADKEFVMAETVDDCATLFIFYRDKRK
jgi:hypothetical protein